MSFLEGEPLSDRELPAVSLLLSPSVIEVLAAALEREGGVIQGARPRSVSYRPGRRIAVTYDVGVAWGREPAHETVVAMADSRGLPEGAPTVHPSGSEVAVWR